MPVRGGSGESSQVKGGRWVYIYRMPNYGGRTARLALRHIQRLFAGKIRGAQQAGPAQ